MLQPGPQAALAALDKDEVLDDAMRQAAEIKTPSNARTRCSISSSASTRRTCHGCCRSSGSSPACRRGKTSPVHSSATGPRWSHRPPSPTPRGSIQPRLRRNATLGALESWAVKDIDAAVRWLDTLSPRDYAIRQQALAVLAPSLADVDPGRALALAAEVGVDAPYAVHAVMSLEPGVTGRRRRCLRQAAGGPPQRGGPRRPAPGLTQHDPVGALG